MIGKYVLLGLALFPLACVSGLADEEDLAGFTGEEPDPRPQAGRGPTATGGSSSKGGSTNRPEPGTGGSGATGTGGGNTGGSGPDPNRACDFPKYQKGTAYQVGDRVIYNGKAFEATDPNASQGDPINSPSLWTEYSGCKVVLPPCSSVSGCPLEKVGGCKWFEQAFPSRADLYTYASACEAMKSFPSFAASGNELTDKRELAAFFANVAHETGFLEYTEEIVPTSPPYHGRGPIQLTHDYNYRDCGAALGVDLISNPNLLATDSVLSWKSALWFWMSYNGPSGNCHQAISGGSFGRTIVVINGCDKPEARISYYTRFCDDFAISDIGSTSC